MTPNLAGNHVNLEWVGGIPWLSRLLTLLDSFFGERRRSRSFVLITQFLTCFSLVPEYNDSNFYYLTLYLGPKFDDNFSCTTSYVLWFLFFGLTTDAFLLSVSGLSWTVWCCLSRINWRNGGRVPMHWTRSMPKVELRSIARNGSFPDNDFVSKRWIGEWERKKSETKGCRKTSTPIPNKILTKKKIPIPLNNFPRNFRVQKAPCAHQEEIWSSGAIAEEDEKGLAFCPWPFRSTPRGSMSERFELAIPKPGRQREICRQIRFGRGAEPILHFRRLHETRGGRGTGDVERALTSWGGHDEIGQGRDGHDTTFWEHFAKGCSFD